MVRHHLPVSSNGWKPTMDNKKVIAGVAGVAVVGILSYLGYKVVKALDEVDVDFMGENVDDDYHFRTWKKDGE